MEHLASKQRFTARFPCLVCGGHEQMDRGRGIRCTGFLSGDGRYAHCSREELAGPLEQEANGTYAHRLDGPCRCGNSHGQTREPRHISPAEICRRRWEELPVWRDPAWGRVATYYYHGPDGAVLYRVQRWERLDHSAKRFLQQRPDPSRAYGWISSLGDRDRVPYHLPAILRAERRRGILICEGEKAADAACALGVLATTNPEGARPGAWRPELSGWFRGRHVVILPDNDAAGAAHAAEVARALRPVAAAVHGLELPDLPPKGDICDWLTAGGTATELRALLRGAPLWSDAARVAVRA